MLYDMCKTSAFDFVDQFSTTLTLSRTTVAHSVRHAGSHSMVFFNQSHLLKGTLFSLFHYDSHDTYRSSALCILCHCLQKKKKPCLHILQHYSLDHHAHNIYDKDILRVVFLPLPPPPPHFILHLMWHYVIVEHFSPCSKFHYMLQLIYGYSLLHCK